MFTAPTSHCHLVLIICTVSRSCSGIVWYDMPMQVLCRSLIMWNSVAPSEAWINSNLPHVSSRYSFIW